MRGGRQAYEVQAAHHQSMGPFLANLCRKAKKRSIQTTGNSVPDPKIVGPLGSGTVIICTDPGPGPSIEKLKKLRNTLISTVLRLLNDSCYF
jgi:hypothetical protein